MADLSDNTNWSELDASNNKNSPNGWPEGMMPSGVNDSARNDKGALKRFWNRANPVQVIAPASGVWTLATANIAFPSAYVDGEIFTFRPSADSVGGDTFQINTLAALPIWKKIHGGTGWTPIVAQDIAANLPPHLIYNASLNAGAGAFVLIDPFEPSQGDGSGGLTVPGNISSAGNISATGPVNSNGAPAAFNFQDRANNAVSWSWFADTNSKAFLSFSGNGPRLAVDTAGDLTLAGSYLYLANGGGTISANGGPLIYGDANNDVFKLGSGNGSFLFQNYAGTNITTLDHAGAFVTNTITANASTIGGVTLSGNTISATGNSSIGGMTLNGGVISGNGASFTGSCNAGNSTIGGVALSGNTINASGGGTIGGTASLGGMTLSGGVISGSGASFSGSCNAGNSTIGGIALSGNTIGGANTITCSNDIQAGGTFRRSGGRGARIECYGGDWDYMSFLASSGVLYFTPNLGTSGIYINTGTGFSDARLKSGIHDTKVDALAAICATPVRRFTWNAEGKRLMPYAPDAVACGLVAQELAETIPEAVGVAAPADDMRYINDTQLTPYLIRAIQQLYDLIKDLGER
jgi:hypothetical protein